MSPEIIASHVYTYAADIWSLGCVLYEIAVRRMAFDAKGMAQLMVRHESCYMSSLLLSFG